jgi:hypothetical protein
MNEWRKVITGVWGVVSVNNNDVRAFPVQPYGRKFLRKIGI